MIRYFSSLFSLGIAFLFFLSISGKAQNFSESVKQNSYNRGGLFVFLNETYTGSSFGQVDYNVMMDLIKDTSKVSDYPFALYSNNLLSSLPFPFGIEFVFSNSPDYLKFGGKGINPEYRKRIGLYFNEASSFGHKDITQLSPDTSFTEYIEYVNVSHFISYLTDVLYHIRIFNWINLYAGAGVNAGFSYYSRINETSGSYIDVENSYSGFLNEESQTLQLKGKAYFRFGFHIPVGIYLSFHSRYSFRMEYQGGWMLQNVFNGDVYNKKMNNLAIGLDVHLYK